RNQPTVKFVTRSNSWSWILFSKYGAGTRNQIQCPAHKRVGPVSVTRFIPAWAPSVIRLYRHFLPPRKIFREVRRTCGRDFDRTPVDHDGAVIAVALLEEAFHVQSCDLFSGRRPAAGAFRTAASYVKRRQTSARSYDQRHEPNHHVSG